MTITAMKFTCPQCGANYATANAEHAGKKTKCKKCGAVFRIPMPSPTGPDWGLMLEKCRQKFGPAPRKFNTATQEYLSIEGSWIASFLFFIPMCKLLKRSRQKNIFGQGNVVWAHTIQANSVLFGPSEVAGPDNP